MTTVNGKGDASAIRLLPRPDASRRPSAAVRKSLQSGLIPINGGS
jgi:hypothetical protein